MPYIELHACSAFSFLRGASLPEQLAEVAAGLEMPAMALLDRNGVYGAQRFAAAAREQNVRPIIGSELTLEDGSILPVLVENRTGYKNLCDLLTQAHLRSEKGKCAIRYDELADFSEGLVVFCSTQRNIGSAGFQPAPSGILPDGIVQVRRKRTRCLRQDGANGGLEARAPENAAKRAKFLLDAFGRNNVYVELQRHFMRGEDRINKALVDLASKFRLPLVATNGVQYAKPSDARCSMFSPACASTSISILPGSCFPATPSAI